MLKILFLIHDLGKGGAEKVLVNLVNNLDRNKFDIHVIALFGGGINEQFLDPDIHFYTVWKKEIRGNSKWMKLFSPKKLHQKCIKEDFDIEISYLEGPSARIISGCENITTKLVSWIHVEQHTIKKLSRSFRSEKEARKCYNRFDQTICVSQYVHDDFCKILGFKKPCKVLYNTVESEKILNGAIEPVYNLEDNNKIRLIAVGTLKESKGYMRLLRIINRLKEKAYRIHLYILGVGPLQRDMENYISRNGLHDVITLLGYQTNPYKYMKQCDLFVCSSFAEGFSTAVTESLIIGTPICTVDVSGMKELLGEHNEYGIVTENDEEALFQGIRKLLDDPKLLSYYKSKAKVRGNDFRTQNTVSNVQDMLYELIENKAYVREADGECL